MSRGRPAAMPPAGWRPPGRIAADGLVVSFLPEQGGPEQAFRFDDLPGSLDLLRSFALAFAALTAADGTHRAPSTASTTYQALRRLARRLAATARPPASARDLVPAHLAELRLASPRDYIKLKVVLREVRGVTPAFAAALREANPPRRSTPIRSLTKAEFNAVMAAARRDIRAAAARIRASRELLQRWHAGELPEGSHYATRARILEHVAATGDVPRRRDGRIARDVQRAGTATEFVSGLHLTSAEVMAGAVLLVGMTGHNAVGVSTLTVEHTRADGGDDATGNPGEGAPGRTTIRVAIIDVNKPRRGRRRRYMTTALADIPDWFLTGPDAPAGDLNTPFGVFVTLCELTADSRHTANSNRLLIGRSQRGGHGVGRHWIFGIPETGTLGTWAADHDLRSQSAPAEPLMLTWPRLRLTYVQLHQRGVAHTDAVLANQYLLRDRGNIDEYRQLVADTLRAEEAKAREFGKIPTLTERDIAEARTDPAGTARRIGVDPATLDRLVTGQLDTALAGCIDELHSPFGDDGSPCTASFLLCLRCPNARATPAHLPVQALAHQRILELRPAMPPDRWARRFGAAEAQLRHLLDQFPPARVTDALHAATPEHSDLIDRLLRGDLDAR